MGWYSSSVNSWNDFIEFVERLNINEEGDYGWFLRGQADSAWGLEPSILRHFKECNLTTKKACGIEFSALRRFRTQAHLFLKPDLVDRESWSIVAWWMLMQHYSCPTRLLDWTESPYIALYFAVEQLPDKDGAIWLFPSTRLDSKMRNSYGKLTFEDEHFLGENSSMAVYPIYGAYHTKRSIAQKGVYTVCTNVLGSHDEIISEAFKDEKEKYPLHKVIIPSNYKYEFLSRLCTMNITASSLFSGLDGVGRSLAELIRLRVWRNS